MLAEPGRLDRFVDRLEGCVGAVRLLVVDRHDDRGSVLQSGWQGAAMAGAPSSRARNPSSALVNAIAIQEKLTVNNADQHPLEDGRAAHRHDLVHLVGAVGGQQQPAAEHEEPREPASAASDARRTGLRSSDADQRRSDWVGMSRCFSGGIADAGRSRAATFGFESGLTVSNDKAMSR